MKQDIAYFDLEKHSTGTLTANISEWASKINVSTPVPDLSWIVTDIRCERLFMALLLEVRHLFGFRSRGDED